MPKKSLKLDLGDSIKMMKLGFGMYIYYIDIETYDRQTLTIGSPSSGSSFTALIDPNTNPHVVGFYSSFKSEMICIGAYYFKREDESDEEEESKEAKGSSQDGRIDLFGRF